MNIAAWTFPVLVVFAVAYLFWLDKSDESPFHIHDFICNKDGTANSRSLGFVGIFMVSVWMLWYWVITENDGAGALVETLIYAFVLAGVASHAIGAAERTRTSRKADNGEQEPP